MSCVNHKMKHACFQSCIIIHLNKHAGNNVNDVRLCTSIVSLNHQKINRKTQVHLAVIYGDFDFLNII